MDRLGFAAVAAASTAANTANTIACLWGEGEGKE